jgi:uncharacterized membrane protein YkvA (DUF1232 family)
MLRLLRALPALAGMIVGLVRDPSLPRPAKIALGVALVYLASPIDLLPETLPFLGIVDDVLVLAVVLDGILNFVDRELVLRHWPAGERSLATLARTAHVLAAWVPRRVRARIFSPAR